MMEGREKVGAGGAGRSKVGCAAANREGRLQWRSAQKMVGVTVEGGSVGAVAVGTRGTKESWGERGLNQRVLGEEETTGGGFTKGVEWASVRRQPWRPCHGIEPRSWWLRLAARTSGIR